MNMSRGALEGEHLCLEHQGNHSHYDPTNCTMCKLKAENANLREAMEELREAEGGTGDTSSAWAKVEAALEAEDG
jgi:hypothetical protein